MNNTNKKPILALLFIFWQTSALAGFKDCVDAAKFLFKRPRLTLLKETDFQIVREEKDTLFFFNNAEPPPRLEEKNFSQWKDHSLPTIPSDTLLTEEQKQHFSSQGLSFSPEKQSLVLVNQYSVISSHNGTRLELPLIIPVNPQGLPVPSRLEKIKRILEELPIFALQKTKYIALSPYPHYSLMPDAENRTFIVIAETESLIESNFKTTNINLFPIVLDKTDSELISTLRHELGHVVARHFYEDGPDSKWLEAIKNDERRVSDYYDTSPSEDFAEAVAFYLSLNNKTWSRPILRAKFFHRFQILDEIFEAH